MARKLTANVLVRNQDGGLTCLRAGTEVPSWAADQVRGEHLFTGQETAGAMPTPPPAAPVSGVVGKPPPRQGKGATDAAWTRYAEANGVQVTEAMSRGEVIAACEKAGVPTE